MVKYRRQIVIIISWTIFISYIQFPNMHSCMEKAELQWSSIYLSVAKSPFSVSIQVSYHFPPQFVLRHFGNNIWTIVSTLLPLTLYAACASVVRNAFYLCNFFPRHLHNLFRGSIRQAFVNMFLSNSNNIYTCINLSVRVRRYVIFIYINIRLYIYICYGVFGRDTSIGEFCVCVNKVLFYYFDVVAVCVCESVAIRMFALLNLYAAHPRPHTFSFLSFSQPCRLCGMLYTHVAGPK